MNNDNQPQGQPVNPNPEPVAQTPMAPHQTVIQPTPGFDPTPDPIPEKPAPPQPAPVQQPVAPAPAPVAQPQYMQPAAPIMSANQMAIQKDTGGSSWAPSTESGGITSKFGLISLILSCSAIVLLLLLIFIPGMVKSLTATYVWFFVFVALGVSSLTLGILSEKGKDKFSLVGLIGLIVSVIVSINVVIIGAYFIKVQIELNKFKNDFNNTNADF